MIIIQYDVDSVDYRGDQSVLWLSSESDTQTFQAPELWHHCDVMSWRSGRTTQLCGTKGRGEWLVVGPGSRPGCVVVKGQDDV